MHIYTYLRVGHGFGKDPVAGEVGDVKCTYVCVYIYIYIYIYRYIYIHT